MTDLTRERITEHIDLDIDANAWFCHRCGRELGPATKGYKYGLLVHERDPAESTSR